MGACVKEAYDENGYAVVEAAAPEPLARTLLGVIQSHMSAKPGVLKSFLADPVINEKPAYEFYGYRHHLVTGFHWGLTARMCIATGKRLIPTYAYFRVYQKGDICTVHSDRQSCEHSFSLALGYSDGVVWPFEIGTTRHAFDEGSKIKAARDFEGAPSRAVALNPGDAILYRGCNYRHGRTTPNPNRWSAHLFLHWVDAEGPYKDFAFDRQQMPTGADFVFPEEPA